MDHQGFGYSHHNHPHPHHSVNQHSLDHLNTHQHRSSTGREEFSGLDNETLDFSQLEDFITDESDANGSYFADTLANSEASKHTGGQPPPPPRIIAIGTTQTDQNGFIRKTNQNGNGPPCAFSSGPIPHSLPDSPPDSGSEPPYSPMDPGSRSPHTKGGGLNSSRNIHDLLIHHPMFTQSGSTLLPIGSHELPPTGSPLPHLIPLRGPPLIPITPSPVNPNTSPTTLTTLGPIQPTQILITHGPGSGGQVTQQSSPISTVAPFYTPLLPVNAENTRSRKRKLSNGSVSPGGKCSVTNVKQEPGGPSLSELSPTDSNSSNNNGNGNGSNNGQTDEEFGFDFSGDPSVFLDSNYQCIKFQPFQESTWHILTDEVFKELSMPYYKVDADKGFNFSNADDAFVCQKKNHFQVTCHARQNGDPKYVKSADGYKSIESFYIHFYGVKVESPNQTIKIEQSQSDRSKKPFHPVMVDLSRDQTAKVTVGRLHFNETTSNNMRKKGKPNPDQRYFYLVVALQAHCQDGVYPIVAHASQRIIVRASNPGQFESDMELSWQKGQTTESIYHAGRVGINTDRPDEALVVYGNCKITGQITHPSDSRAKHDISEVDTKVQLENVQKIRVVRYKYNPEFARLVGLSEEEAMDTGVIAQEVQKVIPDAVKETGHLDLGNGSQIENFLVVNKERIFMENIGAVKELCKVTGKLETRIDQLERITNLKRSGHQNLRNDEPRRRRKSASSTSASFASRSTEFICSSRCVQILIFVLVVIMALCLAAMATLYALEYQKRSSFEHYQHNTQPINSSFYYKNGINSHQLEYFDKIQNSVSHSSESFTQNDAILQSTLRPTSSGVQSQPSKLHNKVYQKLRNKNPPEVTPIPHVKPAVLGRPLKCPVYLTLSPCKNYCCSGRNLDDTSLDYEHVERGNQVSSTTGSLTLQEETTRQSNKTVYVSSLVSGTLMQKNGLENKRRRRQVHEIPRLLNVPSIQLLSVHINQSLGSLYCMVNSDGYHDCLSTENKYFASANLTYQVPLSKYWDGLTVSLIFNVSSKFDITEPKICEKIQHGCSLNNDHTDENKVEAETTSTSTTVIRIQRNVYAVKVDVGTNPFSKITLRFSTDLQEENVCSLNQGVSKFFEFNFYFYRVCDE